MSRDTIKHSRRWVVKIGSSLLTADGKGLDGSSMTTWVDQMADRLEQGTELIIVSSGAVAEGMSRMGWNKRPGQLHELQAAAAIGQMGLIRAWESCFQRRGRLTAQVLLTHDDLTNRSRYLNARSTLKTLLKLGVVPVINENDTVANDELRFGDNDTLAALVANLVEADLLILLTDQQGLYDADPRANANASQISEARVDDPMLEEVAGDSGSGLGRGGMLTKVRAAKTAARSGTATLIAGGREPLVLERIGAGEALGTLILPTHAPAAARKRWLAGHLQVRGRLVLDEGAVRVLRESGKSLLPVGVIRVEGSFVRGEVVSCIDEAGREVARGLVNYSAAEAARIARKASAEIREVLGYVNEEEIMHRSNLVLV
jgi:glutamate 5-kinase